MGAGRRGASRWSRAAASVLLLLAWAGLPGCRGRSFELAAQASAGPRLAVKDIQLGGEIALDKRVTQPTDRFAPEDIVFASVVTEGASAATLKARWVQQDRLLVETAQRIAPSGEAVSEFHAWKPDGWAKGNYEVQILVDDVPAGSRRFSVD